MRMLAQLSGRARQGSHGVERDTAHHHFLRNDEMIRGDLLDVNNSHGGVGIQLMVQLGIALKKRCSSLESHTHTHTHRGKSENGRWTSRLLSHVKSNYLRSKLYLENDGVSLHVSHPIHYPITGTRHLHKD